MASTAAGLLALGGRASLIPRAFFFCALLFCALQAAPFRAAAATPELSLPPSEGSFKADPPGPGAGGESWRALEPGLDFIEIQLPESASRLTALRIDPERFEFTLCAISETGGAARSLADWAKDKGLTAAINASMYLPDGRTSTGYMRSGSHVNNGRIAERFGAFLVAEPLKPGLPAAAIIDKDMPGWRAMLDDYHLAAQNYRMTNAARRILWSPGGPHYSISAIAQDGAGKILFLHSRAPIEAYSFAQQLLHSPLDVRTIMYVEGGAQAGLLVNSRALKRDLGGPHAPSFLITGNLKALLPNVIGVRPRAPLTAPSRLARLRNPVN